MYNLGCTYSGPEAPLNVSDRSFDPTFEIDHLFCLHILFFFIRHLAHNVAADLAMEVVYLLKRPGVSEFIVFTTQYINPLVPFLEV